MQIAIIGKGSFGIAIEHLLIENGHEPLCIDRGERLAKEYDIVFLAVPTQQIRTVFIEQCVGITPRTIFVNCAKGIEMDTGALPHQVAREYYPENTYVVLSGPSFASEIAANIPTTVNLASTVPEATYMIAHLLVRPNFIVEHVGAVLELELAGAMKNIYALAAGYILGCGGRANTHAHLQVVALREYSTLVRALEGATDIILPGVVGDLILTCGTKESRNFTYGYECATGIRVADGAHGTVEGVASLRGVKQLAEKCGVVLPLVDAIHSVMHEGSTKERILEALGYGIVEA